MKTLILMTAILIAFVNCGSEEEEDNLQDTDIIGTWKLFESSEGHLTSEGFIETTTNYDNGYTITFKENGGFIMKCYDGDDKLDIGFIILACSSSNTTKELTGTYSIKDRETLKEFKDLILTYDKLLAYNNYSSKIIERLISFDKRLNILSLGSTSCDEGCVYQFKKI